MKKRLTKENLKFKNLEKSFPILSIDELCGIMGGFTSWDCMFNCMNYIDPSRTSDDYYKQFTGYYNYDPQKDGGIYSTYNIGALNLAGFRATETNSVINSNGYHQILIIDNGDGTSHAVMLTSIGYGSLGFYDPTTGNTGMVQNSNVQTIYRIDKPNSYSGSSYGGYSGSSYGEYSGSSYGGYSGSSYGGYSGSSYGSYSGGY